MSQGDNPAASLRSCFILDFGNGFASESSPACFADEPAIAQDVARGVTGCSSGRICSPLCEVPLPNGRRADMMAICGRGMLTIVEIKVSRADLLGDQKWPDYLDYCDRFYWGGAGRVPARRFRDEARGRRCQA